MIVGKQWIYIHTYKTGGDALRTYASKVPEYVLASIPPCHPLKHGNAPEFGALQPEWWVMTIRLLPEWYQSMVEHLKVHPTERNHHGVRDGQALDARLCYGCGPLSGYADRLIEHFSKGMDTGRIRWLRKECLLDDFILFLESIYGRLPQEVIDRLNASIRETKGCHEYVHDVTEWAEPWQIQAMYAENPKWSELEERLYADQECDRVADRRSEAGRVWIVRRRARLLHGAVPVEPDPGSGAGYDVLRPGEPEHVAEYDSTRAALANASANG